jgi:hypothetical protein
MRIRPVFASLLLIAAGCGGGSQSTPAASSSPAAAPGAATPGAPPQGAANPTAQGLQQLAPGLTQLSQSQAKPVDYELLNDLLPELNGYTKSRARGEQMTRPFAISNAKAHYSAGERTMDIEITDSAMNQMVFAPFAMFMAAGYEERSDDGYKRSGTIAGSPGFESWEKKSNRGEVTVIVANRFVVQATGRRVEGIDPVKKAVEAIDLAKLATMK